ncbi:DNA repair protein XRCC1 [Culicoides brevitarsis]|uniref:DNA repair protein XRCC1 n=1 Tax=Culicoides brevitarsis TaxID=469753 RepID=UPI00307B96C6
MPKVKLTKVVKVSSESPAHLASNLLLLEPTKTTQWRTKDPSEDTAEVILQLEGPSKITNINCGNCYSAKIEIQVGSSADSDKFETLLPSQDFMNETESRNGTNFSRVRTFLTSDFDPKTSKGETWDLVKVICRQPYTKSETFGLAFIAIYTDKKKIVEEETKEVVKSPAPLQKSPRMVGKFKLRDSSDEEVAPKMSLLERWKKEKTEENVVTPPPKKKIEKTKPKVTDRNRMSLLYDSSSSDEENKRVKHSAKKLKVQKENVESRKRKSDDDSPAPKQKKTKNFSDFLDDAKPSSSSKAPNVPKIEKKNVVDSPKPVKTEKKPTPVKKPKVTKPFNELLSGVRIVISGIQNPERADIRQKAFDMGAKYAADWNDTCTHLICAFKNTPKFREVKGKGKIVTKDWIVNGHRLRKRLPWRRYALDDADRLLDESEEEIFEQKPDEDAPKEKKDDVLAMYDLNYDVPATNDDVYNRSTDDDNSRDAGIKPKLFKNKAFYVHVNVEVDKSMYKHLQEVIGEQDGQIVTDLHKADFILTAEKLDGSALGAKGDILDPQWVLECAEMESLVPVERFSMNS